jgi:hypothetical protein
MSDLLLGKTYEANFSSQSICCRQGQQCNKHRAHPSYWAYQHNRPHNTSQAYRHLTCTFLSSFRILILHESETELESVRIK